MQVVNVERNVDVAYLAAAATRLNAEPDEMDHGTMQSPRAPDPRCPVGHAGSQKIMDMTSGVDREALDKRQRRRGRAGNAR